MIVIEFPKCTFRYFHETKYCETVFECGIVPAAPNEDKNYVDFAKKLGYGKDTLAMCREHELFHTWLMVKAGYPYSPVLWSVVNKFKLGVSKEELDEEEAIVLDFQAFLNKMEAGQDLKRFVEKNNLNLELLEAEALQLRYKL